MFSTNNLMNSGSLIAAIALSMAQPFVGHAEESDDKNQKAKQDDIVVTAVARGRDRLDSAISTNSLRIEEIQKVAPRSVAEIFRNIPGVRSESSGGEGNANISIRGLPIGSGGAKFLQLQEDGLPVLEFGDITFGNADIFLRADLNLAQVESIRGGSASTFASNSPGGVINLISKTGDVEGGAIQAMTGIDYRDYRIDFDYGSKLSDTLRFHIGGFYRQGEGPRDIGYDGNKGGQLKFNITKTFDGGYIRLYGKYLDDRSTAYLPMPVRVTGTDSNPNYEDIANFKVNRDVLLSPFFTRNVTLDGTNSLVSNDIRDGHRPLVKSFGVEAQFELAGWTVTERFRFSDISGRFISNFPANVDSAAAVATALGGANATLSYATGPLAGSAITNPSTLNGNGLLAQLVVFDTKLNSLDNITNDLRASRVTEVGPGTLTTTVGFYKSRQVIDTEWLWTSILMDVRGNGQAALVDVTNASGRPVTQRGVFAYGASYFGGCCRRRYDVEYNVNAPFASINYMFNGLSFGASVRRDFGDASGSIAGADLGGGRVGTVSRDIDNNGIISDAETRVAVIPLDSAAPVNYNYSYWSYSTGVNYRFVDHMSVFARYSRGARANADRLLFGPAVSTRDGSLLSSAAAVDVVKQAEAGAKYRKNGLVLNITGFWARTEEQNFEATRQVFIDRVYDAYGVELDGSIRRGPFSLTAGATWTKAKIKSDALNPGAVGNTPRRQADLIFQVTPQYESERFTVGANFIGTTSSFAQDNNQLKLPGFTQVNAFVQVRVTPRLMWSLNANNLFDVNGFTEAEEGSIPANGIVRARPINGRTVSTALRMDF